MLGYWKWLYNLFKVLFFAVKAKRNLTKIGMQIKWLILDMVIVLGVAFLGLGFSLLGYLAFVVGVFLTTGHMIYIEETY